MRRRTVQRLALRELKKPERLQDLAEYQQAKVRELEARSEQDLANRGSAVLPPRLLSVAGPRGGERRRPRAHRHRHALHVGQAGRRAAPDCPGATRPLEAPGRGRRTLFADVRAGPHAAEEGTDHDTHASRRVRRDPALPILIGDDIFIRGIRRGVERGEYIYQKGELLYGPGDPVAQISIDEESVVSTMAYAKNTRLWPRQPKDGGGGAGARGGTGAGGDKPGPGRTDGAWDGRTSRRSGGQGGRDGREEGGRRSREPSRSPPKACSRRRSFSSGSRPGAGRSRRSDT